jgi:hypothetical protein
LSFIEKTKITPQQPTTPQPPTTAPPEGDTTASTSPMRVDARNHYPRIKHHTPPPKAGATTSLPIQRPGTTGLLSQSPIVCSVKSCRDRPPEEGLSRPQSLLSSNSLHQNHTHYRHGPSNESSESR